MGYKSHLLDTTTGEDSHPVRGVSCTAGDTSVARALWFLDPCSRSLGASSPPPLRPSCNHLECNMYLRHPTTTHTLDTPTHNPIRIPTRHAHPTTHPGTPTTTHPHTPRLPNLKRTHRSIMQQAVGMAMNDRARAAISRTLSCTLLSSHGEKKQRGKKRNTGEKNRVKKKHGRKETSSDPLVTIETW